VSLYVTAAGVRSNYTEFWLFMYLYLYCINVCDVINKCYVVVNMKFSFGIENTL